MTTYKCPLCGSPLTPQRYHSVVKQQEKTEKVRKGELEKLQKEAAAAKAAAAASKHKEREVRAKAKLAVVAAKKAGTVAEQRKSAIRNKRLMARIKKLEEEKKMLKTHTSPQEIGLADEGKLVRKLQTEFPSDRIEHVGKGGDVLQFVVLGRKEIGCIVYECKRTDRISSNHIKQTATAKKTRNADYGILVTTGSRRGFAGLDQEAGVFLVAQAGVLTLARICRDSLVTMAKQKLAAAAKIAAAKRLMDYVTSPVCKTPLEAAITQAERAHRNLLKEMKQHANDWRERHEIYQTIHYDVSHVQKNIARVLCGNEPLKLDKPKLQPLALPLK